MSSPLDLALLILATWRISSLLVTEAGPWDILARLRGALGVYNRMTPTGLECVSHHAPWGLFCCVWCMSIWVAVGVLLLYPIAPALIWICALSAGAIIIQSITGRA